MPEAAILLSQNNKYVVAKTQKKNKKKYKVYLQNANIF